MTKRTRRTYTTEFKQDAVKMCQQPGISVAEVSRNLGLHHTLLRKWKRQMSEHKPHKNQELSDSERAELIQLRKENKQLRMERDLLKKRQHSSRTSRGEVCLYSRESRHFSCQIRLRVSWCFPQWILPLEESRGI